MLARLDEIPGVDASRVDRSGRRFLLTLEAGADESAIAASAREELGASAVILGGRAESDVLASYRRGETWVRSDETIRLSREEAQVLGARFAEEAAQEIGLSPEKTGKLAQVIAREIAAAFARVHGRDDALQALDDDFEMLSTRVEDSARSFLTDEELQGLRAFSAVKAQEREERREAPECEPPPDPPR